MSATAFQRLRREQSAKEQPEVKETEEGSLTNKELKALLDEKGIEYDAKANKETLTKLLKGAE